MTNERERRQELIRSLIRSKTIRNQNELLDELGRAGVEMTQSTLSRELKALGVGKAPDGHGGYRYVTRDTDGPFSPVAAFVTGCERAKNLIVVKTPPGNAQGVAHALDAAEWGEVMGTLAGDDTILIICRSDDEASAVETRLAAITGR
jgi:transcriptional regulator of arginine metabolism